MTAVKNTLSQYTLINNNTAVRSAPIPEETTILRYLCPAALLLNSQVINKTSRFISLILRHKPETIDIALDEHGWANVDELIAGISKTREFNREMLEEIVWTDNKQRFTFNEDKTKIRANQGHSIPVDVELPAAIPPETLWHGTGEKYVASIDQQGLIPKGRLYVHLSSDAATATKVGSRHGKPVLYIVKTKEMYDDGYSFFLSKNGAWLTKEVPVKYLIKEQTERLLNR